MANLIIFGASRGLGAAFSTGLPQENDTVWAISRSKPKWLTEDRSDDVNYIWVKTDLTKSDCAKIISREIVDKPIDMLVYNAGIWESTAFTQSYDFEKIDPAENLRVIQVNLTAAIDCIQTLLPNVRKAKHGKIVVVGSTSSLPNVGAPEVAYSASKFGVLGMAHALREICRKDGIAVTCVNPGLIATEFALEQEAEHMPTYDGRFGMPVSDLVKIVKTLLTLSPFCCVKEINVPAMMDTHA
ncbi:MAG: SDR family NAD(P)-dependent oxidoreductase [Chloroflexota bacterium]